MASLLEKAQTLISANLHDMVDKALEANSVAVMKQYIRDAESNLDALEDAAATVGGEVKTLERKYKEYKQKADKLDRNVDALIMQGKTDLARAAQTELNTTRPCKNSITNSGFARKGNTSLLRRPGLNYRLN
jgi:phage shock protein A